MILSRHKKVPEYIIQLDNFVLLDSRAQNISVILLNLYQVNINLCDFFC
jgi:hypothetical protein